MARKDETDREKKTGEFLATTVTVFHEIFHHRRCRLRYYILPFSLDIFGNMQAVKVFPLTLLCGKLCRKITKMSRRAICGNHIPHFTQVLPIANVNVRKSFVSPNECARELRSLKTLRKNQTDGWVERDQSLWNFPCGRKQSPEHKKDTVLCVFGVILDGILFSKLIAMVFWANSIGLLLLAMGLKTNNILKYFPICTFVSQNSNESLCCAPHFSWFICCMFYRICVSRSLMFDSFNGSLWMILIHGGSMVVFCMV